ncbi:MAG: ParB/RepB/Spo0J family partition protein [Thermoplasmata archaeon]|nr:ParB/RepB/Spo0J family partition protein [Thermoplasmata archaeon]
MPDETYKTKPIPIGNLILSDFNVRQDVGDITDLKESIKIHGLLQPIVVRPTDEQEETYEVVAGRRRYESCRELGFKRIPCFIKKTLGNREAIITSFEENEIRGNMTEQEKAMAIKRALDMMEGSERKNKKTLASELHMPINKINEILELGEFQAYFPDDVVIKTKRKMDTGLILPPAVAKKIKKTVDQNPALKHEILTLPKPERSEMMRDFASEYLNLPAKKVNGISERDLFMEKWTEDPSRPIDEIKKEVKSVAKEPRVLMVTIPFRCRAEIQGALHKFAANKETTISKATRMLVEEALTEKGYLESQTKE